jgi:hypothetical protein
VRDLVRRARSDASLRAKVDAMATTFQDLERREPAAALIERLSQAPSER